METKQKVLLVIRDGRGQRDDTNDNAIAQAETPVTDHLMNTYPHTFLGASGKFVWLPDGVVGNSEVGHLTIGSGRIINQSLVRIDNAIEDWSFFTNQKFLEVINHCKQKKTWLHLMWLLQSSGVHSHTNHLLALLDICKQQSFEDVYLHIFTDGRDSQVTDSINQIQTIQTKMSDLSFGKIVTVGGRFYAMDRDKRWGRTDKCYQAIASATCESKFDNVLDYIQKSHKNNITDEFIVPACSSDYDWIWQEDGIVFFNFRTDRTRQLTKALIEKDFTGFDTKETKEKKLFFVAMTKYYENMNGTIAFDDIVLSNLLWEVVSNHNMKQLRISETEKYAHVTFFFNGQREKEYPWEDRVLVDSPKVETYDLSPKMSIEELTAKITENLDTQQYDLVITNLVNLDLVGHTWVKDAIIKAVEAVDKATDVLVKSAMKNGYTVIITADHGNAEDQTKERKTSHTNNLVPFILVWKEQDLTLKNWCGLQDIAPTILDLLWIQKPKGMTGESLIKS